MKDVVSIIVAFLLLSMPVFAKQNVPHHSNHGFELNVRKSEPCVQSIIQQKNSPQKFVPTQKKNLKHRKAIRTKEKESIANNEQQTECKKEVSSLEVKNKVSCQSLSKSPLKNKNKDSDASDIIIACAIVLGVLAVIAGMVFWGIYLYNLWWYI